MSETRWFLKLGRLPGENLYLFSWWISLAAKLTVSGRMDLVTVMATYAKMVMIPNIFDMQLLSCLYWILLLCLNIEVSRFTYSRIRREDCEGTSCSYALSEASVDKSGWNSVGFCSPLWWLTWQILPPWRFPSLVNIPSLVKGLRVSDMDSVPRFG